MRSRHVCTLLLFLFSTLFNSAGYAATVASQDFGQAQIGTSSTVSVPVPAVSPGPASISLRFSIDFSLGACTPAGSGCSAAVTFDPHKAGLRQDAIIVKDANGQIVEEIFLHGIGLGPVPAFVPALATFESAVSYANAGMSVAPNGKVLLSGDTNSTFYEYDPATNTVATIPGPTPGQISIVPVPDAAGNIYYVNSTGIRRFDTITQIDSLVLGVSASRIVVSPSGAIYYLEQEQVFELAPNSTTPTLVAGNGTLGYAGDGGPATGAEFRYAAGIALDLAGNLYIADYGNHRIRKVSTAGVITTVAGTGVQGDTGDGGLAVDAELDFPSQIAVDPAGNIYVVDLSSLLRRIDSGSGLISTIAGNSPQNQNSSIESNPFYEVGVSASAQYLGVSEDGSMTVDNDGNVWVAANGEGFFKISAATSALQFAFSPMGQSESQTVSLANVGTANLNPPVVTSTGQNAADFSSSNTCSAPLAKGNACNISVSFLAGSHPTSVATVNVFDNASSSPQTIAVSGTSGALLPASTQIPAVSIGSSSPTPQTVSVQFPGNAAGVTAVLAYGLEFALGQHSCSGTGTVSCSVNVTFTPLYPGLRQDAIQFLDSSGSLVYQCYLNATAVGPQWFADPGNIGTFTMPASTKFSTIDSAGNLYAVSSGIGASSGQVYKYNPQTNQWSVVAGQSYGGVDTGDGGLATSATLSYVNAVALDPAGNLFIAETFNLRKVDVHSGIITTIAKQGGDSIAVDQQGYVYVGNSDKYEVFRVDPTTGAFTVFAGNGAVYAPSNGDGGPATAAFLNYPTWLLFDNTGENLFIQTTTGIRTVNLSSGIINTFSTYFGNSIAIDPAGELYITRGYITVIPPSSAPIRNIDNESLVNIDFPAIRHPSGTIYITGGTTYTPTLLSPFSTLTAIVDGPASASASISLANVGNANLAFNSANISGANANLFSETTTCASTLSPTQSCAINLAFVPTEAGNATADFTLTSSLPNLQSILNGVGVVPTVEVLPASINFASIPIGDSIVFYVTVLNTSVYPVTFSNISISGPNASEFTFTSNCSLAYPLSSCDILVRFNSTILGARTASLNITDDAAGSPQIIPIAATAIAGAKPVAVWSSWYPTFTPTHNKTSTNPGTKPYTSAPAVALGFPIPPSANAPAPTIPSAQPDPVTTTLPLAIPAAASEKLPEPTGEAAPPAAPPTPTAGVPTTSTSKPASPKMAATPPYPHNRTSRTKHKAPHAKPKGVAQTAHLDH